MLAGKPSFSLSAPLISSCGDLTFWPGCRYGVWKLRELLTVGLLICTSLRAGNTPQAPLILSLPLAQLSLWDMKSTDRFVEPLQENRNGSNNQAPWNQEQINHARFLFSRLLRDGIAIKKTLPELLVNAKPAKRSILCRKCLHFYQHVRPGEISSTGGLTAMVKSQQQINDFVKRPLGSIRRVAHSSPLASITGMYHRKGFPVSSRKISNFLSWEYWRQGEEGKAILDRGLLRIFSSMLAGRGLPAAPEVQAYLDQEIWWHQDGDKKILDRSLLRVFSSMFNGRGLPKAQEVKAYLDMDVWWLQEGDEKILDRKLLQVFSSIFNGRGLPSPRVVQDYLDQDVWWQQQGDNKVLDRQLLRAFSTVFAGRGLPDIRQSRSLLDWLCVDGKPDDSVFHLMGILYSQGHKSLGLPDLNLLQLYERDLYARLQLPFGGSEGSNADDGTPVRVRIKQVVLYLANRGGSRHLPWADCVAFLDGLPFSWPDPLETLYAVLHLQGGGPGVQAWLSVLRAGAPEVVQTFLLGAMVQGVPLTEALYVVEHIDQCDWQVYFAIMRQSGHRPDSKEWARIKGYLRTWRDILPLRDLQIRYLTLVLGFPWHRRDSFLAVESLQAVLKILPTPQLMGRLAENCSSRGIMDAFQACLDYHQACKSGNIPAFHTLLTLFSALLKIQSPFYLRSPRPLPEQALINIENAPDTGVIININPEAGLQDTTVLMWHFLVTVMDELQNVQYEVANRRIILHPRGSDLTLTYPVPRFAKGRGSFYIRNWSRDDLMHFFAAVESDESLCTKSEGASGFRSFYGQPGEQNLQRQQNPVRQNTAGKPASGEPPSEPVSLGMVQGLVKNRVLPPRSVENLLTEACRGDVLNLADLEELAHFKEQLTLEQTIQIIQRIPAFIPQDVVSQWTALQQEKMTRDMGENPFLLSSDEVFWNTMFGADDWP